MGRSDPLLFPEYTSLLSTVRRKHDSVAFLGFSQENVFTRCVDSSSRDFYDLSLCNWEINSRWRLKKQYDLIVSTRCPYFSREPIDFVDRCRDHLTDDGVLFLDWGLGDHWRFQKFKVGWVRDGEHEWAYKEDNFLHSCLWRDEFENDIEVKKFYSYVSGQFGYKRGASLSQIVRQEVPAVVDYDYDSIKFKFLWPEAPQLYIMTLSRK